MKNFKLLVEQMGKHMQANYPFEACGIITKDFEFIPSDNLSNKPRISFMVDPILLMKYDGNIWGIFHSHPNEQHKSPSAEDLQLLVYDDIKFIIGVDSKFYIYWFDEEKQIKRYEILNENHCTNQ